MEEEQGQGVPPATTVADAPEFNAESAISKLNELGYYTLTKGAVDGYEIGKHGDNPVLKGLEDKIVSAKTKAFYEGLERDVLESTGIPKTHPQEKAYEYLKRVANQQRTTIDALREQTPDLDKVKLQYEEEVKTVTVKYNQIRYNDKLESAIEKLDPPTPEGVTGAEADAWKGQIRALIAADGAKLPHRFTDEGELIITIDGVDQLDARTQKPLTLAKVLEIKNKALLKKPETAPTGTGTTPKPAPTGGTAVPKTEEELHTEMEKEGLSPLDNPAQWGNELRKRATGYGIKISGRSPIAA